MTPQIVNAIAVLVLLGAVVAVAIYVRRYRRASAHQRSRQSAVAAVTAAEALKTLADIEASNKARRSEMADEPDADLAGLSLTTPRRSAAAPVVFGAQTESSISDGGNGVRPSSRVPLPPPPSEVLEATDLSDPDVFESMNQSLNADPEQTP